MGKLGAAWFIGTGARKKPSEELTQTLQISVQSWHNLFWPSCRAQAWYFVSICHLLPSLMQWQVASQLSAVSIISFSYFFSQGQSQSFLIAL